MYAGVLYAPVSPAYSMARDHGRLREIVRLVQPGLVFADDGTAYARAIQATLDPDVEVVTSTPASSTRRSTPLADLEAAPAADVDRAHAAVGPDTIAKILFTSGSTGHPKGVINTQRMLCANQEMLRAVFGFLADAPPTLCDWLPWHHTAGGNHNFGIVLYNGGTFYLDGGRPTPDGIETTVRNLTEIAATAHFTVPANLRGAAPLPAPRFEPARALLQPARDLLLRGGRTEPALLR